MSGGAPEKGALTFDAEGNDVATSPYYSRRLHWPGGASGVTIGRGYDMKTKTEAKIKADLVAAGLAADLAGKYAKGAGLEGAAAKAFARDNRDKLTELTWDQQLVLFETTYDEHLKDAKWRAANQAASYGAVDWGDLDHRIRDVVVDLRYRGDYKQSTFSKIQAHVVANDYDRFREAMHDHAFWVTEKGVPQDRYERRADFLPGEDGARDDVDDGWNDLVDDSRIHESPNRGDRPASIAKPTHIVIHITGTDSFTSVKNRFLNAKESASAHYLVDQQGKIHQFVKDKDRAWHAGIKACLATAYGKNDGTWRQYKRYFSWSSYPAGSKYLDSAFKEVKTPAEAALVSPPGGGNWPDYDYFEKRWGTTSQPFGFSIGKDPNAYSIGIELLSFGGKDAKPYPDALYQGLDVLLADLCEKYGIARDRQHIVGHEDVDPCARWGWDPNQGFDWDRVLNSTTKAPEKPPAEDVDHGSTTHFELASMTEDQRYEHLRQTWKRAQKRFEHEGDSVYDFQEENGRVNLLSARGLLSSTLEPVANTRDAWDDTLFVIWKDQEGRRKVRAFTISTEPNDPKNPDHSSTLEVGMHRYFLATHHKKGKRVLLTDCLAAYPQKACYRALNPAGGVATYIDANRNLTDDPGEKSINDWEINIHFGGEAEISTWSWGCQVVKGWSRYIELIRLIESDASIRGSIDNELAEKPGKDGTRDVIYLLVEGTFLRPPGVGMPVQGAAPEALYELNEKGEGGFFPVGANNFWHGGVHLDTEAPIVAVADGEVVAYRINEAPLPVKLGGAELPLSSGFVLARHQRYTPKGQLIEFFSLYMHLLPLGAYSDAQKAAAPSPLKKRTFAVRVAEDGVGLNIRDGASRDTVLGVIPKDAHFQVVPGVTATWSASYSKVSHEGVVGFAALGGGRAKKIAGDTYQCTTREDMPEDASKLGLNVREKGSGSRVLRVAPRGAELRFKAPNEVAPGGKLAAGWFELQDGGWVYTRAGSDPTIELTSTLAPESFDAVVKVKLPISAGAVVGHPGPYLVRDRTVHFEILAADVEFMKNPKGDKGGAATLEIAPGTVFKKRTEAKVKEIPVDLPAGSRLRFVDRRGDLRKVAADELGGWAPRSALGTYSAQTGCYTLEAPLATLSVDVPSGAAPAGTVTINAAKGDKLHYRGESGDHRLVSFPFSEADRAKKTGWAPLAELGKWDKDSSRYVLGSPLAKLLEEPPAEGFDFTEDAGKNEALLHTPALPPSDPAVRKDRQGKLWQETEYAPEQKGWIQQDGAGVTAKSPYDWPRWQRVEEHSSYSEDGLCDASEIVALVDTDGDGAVAAAEIKAALANPRVADRLRHVACQHPTEWSGEVKGLDRLSGPPWHVPSESLTSTKEYIQKLGFWDAVKGPGLPAKDKVWNLHPIGFLEHLRSLATTPDRPPPCGAREIHVSKKGEEDALAPGPSQVVRVVAQAPFQFSTKLSVSKSGQPSTKDVLADIKRLGLRDTIKKYKGNEPKSSGWSPSASAKFAYSDAKGKLDLHAALATTQVCDAPEHRLTLSAVGSKDPPKTIAPMGGDLTVAFDGVDAPVAQVKPQRYRLEGAGCEGAPRAVTIEVFPASTTLWEVNFEAKKELFDKVMERIDTVLKGLFDAETSLTISGGVAGCHGWREEDDGRVYLGSELTAKGGVEVGFEVKLSFMKFFPIVPESLVKYVADIGLSLGVTGGFSVAGTLEQKEYVPAAPGARIERAAKGTLALEGSIGLSIGLYAALHVVVVSVEATGKVKTEFKAGGKVEWTAGKMTVSPSCALGEGQFLITLTVESWLTKSENEWSFQAWPEQKFGAGYVWTVYDHAKEQAAH